jgi:ER-bound oxygenase mpaB/B'/Rubber oxygenase, catalytic domain
MAGGSTMALSRNGPIGTAEIEEICDLRDDAYRNRWITYAYWKISQRLKERIGDNASWCTFSTWSSRTIGESIRLDKATRRIDELIYDEESSISIRDHPALLRLQYLVTTRSEGDAQLALAIGNRVIFHEIGTAVVQLLDWIDEYGADDLDGWVAYRKVNVEPYEVNFLFQLPESGPEELWNGLDCYYRAASAPSDEQAELVLQGNIRLGAYEQERADRLLKVALEPRPDRYVRRELNPDGNTVFRLKVERSWALEGPFLQRIISEQFAELMTRYVMALEAPLFSWTIRHLRLGHGLPPPDDGKSLYPPALETLDDRDVRDLFDAYDHSGGVPEWCAAENWTRFEDRMNFIVNLFRAGQQDPNLYRPLPDADLRTLDLDLSDEHLDDLRELGDKLDPWMKKQVATSGKTSQEFLDNLVDCGFEKLLAAGPPRPNLPKWADRGKLWAGQAFFRAHGLEIGAALFSASLPMSYTARRGAQVLATTTDLTDPEQARRRLAETGQMLLDTMASDDSSKPPLDRETHAYQAARGVRLFHAAVRLMILDRPPPERWNTTELGVPLNQEDLIGTLAAFTVAVIGSLDQMGVTVTVQDRDAYFHLWLVIGELLGIDYKRLFRDKKLPAGQPLTYADMQLVSRVIFDRNSAESPEGETLMGALLDVSEGSMPPRLRDVPRALTRALIGDRHANMLRVPPAGATRYLASALRPVNAMISPYVRRNVLGAAAGRFTKGAYSWWINQGRGQRPPWRLKEAAPSSFQDSITTQASRSIADAVDRAPFVPRSVRRRVSGFVRPNAP